MANFAFVQQTLSTSSGVLTQAFPSDNIVGNAIIVVVVGSAGGVTDSQGNIYTEIQRTTFSDIAIFAAVNILAGPNVVSASAGSGSLWAAEYSSVNPVYYVCPGASNVVSSSGFGFDGSGSVNFTSASECMVVWAAWVTGTWLPFTSSSGIFRYNGTSPYFGSTVQAIGDDDIANVSTVYTNTVSYAGGPSPTAGNRICVFLNLDNPTCTGAALSISCDSPPGAVLGSPYAHKFPAVAGTTPYVFSITSGSLPPGLVLDVAAGTVSGIPTTLGTFPFTIGVTDSTSPTHLTASANCSITVSQGGAWIIQEVETELEPSGVQLGPNAGRNRYTVRCINASQIGSYLQFWKNLGGGGGGVTSSPGFGGASSLPPAAPTSPPDSGSSTGGVNIQTASYTATVDDSGKLISFNSASAVTLTLPASSPSTIWTIAIENVGAGALTVFPNGKNLDGSSSSLVIAQNQGALIYTDGTNYFTERGLGGVGTVTHTGGTLTADLPVFGAGGADIKVGTKSGNTDKVLSASGSFLLGDFLTVDSNGNAIDSTIAASILGTYATKLGVQQSTYISAADTGTANAYAVSITPTPTLGGGSILIIKVAHTNTGASTIATNGAFPIAVKKESSSGLTDLAAGDWQAGAMVVVINDGSLWQWIGGSTSSGGGGGTVTSVALTTPSWLTVTGSPVTVSGTLAITGTSEPANEFLASPNGSSGALSPRAIVPADLPVATTSALGIVKPDGTTITISSGVISAVGGGAAPNFADNETPSGLQNGSNQTFTLAHTPNPGGSLQLYYNGILQDQGVDYSLSTNTITFTTAKPNSSLNEWLKCWYRY